MKKIFFVTGNRDKANEVNDILARFGISVEHEVIDTEEIQDKDVEKVARGKAEEAYNILKRPVLVEDTGLYINAMNGYPGSLIKHFLDAVGYEGIIELLKEKDRSAEAVTVMAFCDSRNSIKTFKGVVAGSISESVTKGYGFAWDVIFTPDGYDKTYAELGMAEKNKISQRRLALERFARWLKDTKA